MKKKNTLSDDLDSFQNGVDIIYNKCSSCGSTPSAKTPTAISTSIQNIYTNRYNAGYNAGSINKKQLILIGSVTNISTSASNRTTKFDITTFYNDYTNITVDNFLFNITSVHLRTYLASGAQTSNTYKGAKNFYLIYLMQTILVFYQ